MSGTYTQMERALQYIDTHLDESPSLSEIAGAVGLSAFFFQRRFREWVGLSPKQYLQHRRVERAKSHLRVGEPTLRTALDIGLSGAGRLHDLFVSIEAVTPGMYKSRGRFADLRLGVHDTPLGPCSIALTDRGICHLAFLDERSRKAAEAALREDWPLADIRFAETETADVVERIFRPKGWRKDAPFHLHLRGTNFQVQVWRALLRIPTGRTVTYGDLCEDLGRPKAFSRAVGQAIAHNPAAHLIPCHRVIRRSGALGGYRFGLPVKQALLEIERRGQAGSGEGSR